MNVFISFTVFLFALCQAQEEWPPNPDPEFDNEFQVGSIIYQQFRQVAEFAPEAFEMVEKRYDLPDTDTVFVKVRIGGGEYVHLRVEKPNRFRCCIRLTAYQRMKTATDRLVSFRYTYDPKPATPEVTTSQPGGPTTDRAKADDCMNEDMKKAIEYDIKKQFAEMANEMEPEMFHLVRARGTSAKAGTVNYAKVQINKDTFVHLKIYKPSNYPIYPMRLMAFQRPKALEDNLDAFSETMDGTTTPGPTERPDPRALTPLKHSNEMVQEMLESGTIKADLKRELGCSYLPMYQGVYFRKTIESKPQYIFVKVQLARGNFVHLKLAKIVVDEEKQLTEIILVDFQAKKKMIDSLDYF